MTKRLIALLALVAVGGCSLDKQKAPMLTGPSELGLSIALSASPDLLEQNGVNASVVTVTARDAYSQPVQGLSLALTLSVDGVVSDFGTLSTKNVSTNAAGVATATYVTPPTSPSSDAVTHMVRVYATPVGTNYDQTTSRSVSIKLTPPTITVPPGTPIADFHFSPSAPKTGASVAFDGSLSTDDGGQITSYSWTFGDGEGKTGITVSHDFASAGDYIVRLTITDSRGQSATKSRTVTVTGSN